MLRLSCYVIFILCIGACTPHSKPAPQVIEPSTHVKHVGAQRLYQQVQTSHYRRFDSQQQESQAYFDQVLNQETQHECLFNAAHRQQLAQQYRDDLSAELSHGQIKHVGELLEKIDQAKQQRLHYLQQQLATSSAIETTRLSPCGETALPQTHWQKQQQLSLYWLQQLGLDEAQSQAYLRQHYQKLIQALLPAATQEQIFNRAAQAYLHAYDIDSAYYPSAKPHPSNKETKGYLGLTLSATPLGAQIIAISPLSPAAQHLQYGDIIIAIADPTQSWIPMLSKPLSDISDLTKGEVGTEAQFQIYRPSQGLSFNLALIRQPPRLQPEMASRLDLINEHSARLTLSSLPIGISQQVEQQLVQLNQQGIDNLVIDLRNNGGGALNEVTPLLFSLGLQEHFFALQLANGKIKTEPHQPPKQNRSTYQGKLSVWINHCTGAGAELLAASLQDHQRAIIIGSRSYGKGTVQVYRRLAKIYDLEEPPLGDTAITIAMLFRPNGSSIQGYGVKPDIHLPFSCPAKGSRQGALTAEKRPTLIPIHFSLQQPIAQLRSYKRRIQPTTEHLSQAQLSELAQDLADYYQQL